MDRILFRISSGCLAKIAATDGDNANKKNTNIPRAVKFGYYNFTFKGNATSAKCKFCSEKTTGTTSNFGKHLQRLHKER